MQARALACSNDKRRRAGALGLRKLDVAIGAKRHCHAIDGVDWVRVQAFEISAGDGDPKPVDAAIQKISHRLGCALGADRVARVVPLHGVVGEREIARRARQRPDMVEARHEWKSARTAKPAISRLQSEQTAQRSRHADRAVGVGSKRQRHETAGDRGRRSAGRSAAHAVEIVRIARRAVVGVLAGEIIGVFAHVQRADQNGAGRFEALDQRRITDRRFGVAIDLRPGDASPGRQRRTNFSPRTARRREERPARRARPPHRSLGREQERAAR